jgi:hypothetical protein
VARLLEGKARDFRVRADDLLSEGQILNAVYTRVIESDLIPADQRTEIVDRIAPALTQSEGAPVEEEAEAAAVGTKAWFSRTTSAVVAMGLATSIVGALVASVPEIVNLDTKFPNLIRTALATGALSLLVIGAWILLLRVRTAQDEVPTRGAELERYVRFESEVAATLKRLGVSVLTVPRGAAGDFLVERNGQRYLLEVKAWRNPLPARIVAEIAERTKRAAESLGGAEPIIVTRASISNTSRPTIEGIKILTLNELRNYLLKRSA